jgi:hypothetical protein
MIGDSLQSGYQPVNHVAAIAIAVGAGQRGPRKAGAGDQRASLATRRRQCFGFGIIAALALLAAVADAGPARAGTEAAPKPRITAKIAFAGDSIVDNYWSGMTRVIAANACLKGSVELGRFAHNGTGLTRGDKLYWPREVRRIGETFKPDLFVLSVGLNDRQFIVDGTGARTAWGAPDWTDKYRAQIVEFLKGAAASKAAVLLVGMPVMRDAVDNADVEEKNRMFAEAVAVLGASNIQYVEPWKLKSSGADAFSSYGADRNGRMVQIRTADGQHFTVAGEDLIAPYLYPKIVTAFAQMERPLDRACETADKSADKSPQMGAEAGADKSADKGGGDKGRQP